LISIENISLFLGKEKSRLVVSNLELNSGLWALVGRNGAGKSTFLKALSGVNKNIDGTIKLNGKLQSAHSDLELAKTISVVYSKTELFGNHTALDVLNLGRTPYQGLFGKMTTKDKAKVAEVIALIGLESLLNKPFEVLSDGEKQMIMIGRALVQDTRVILLDEPTAFLDVVNRAKVIGLLAKISKESNKLIVFASHNLGLIEKFCDGMLLVKNCELTIVEAVNAELELTKLFEDEV
jgi:iron complex transport system ATP-binding protein